MESVDNRRLVTLSAVPEQLERLLELARRNGLDIQAAPAEECARPSVEEALKFTQFSMDNARLGIFWLRADGSVVSANREACAYLGYTAEEIAGRSFLEIDTELTAQTWQAHWEQMKADGSLVYESHHRRRSGEIFPVEAAVNYLEFQGKQYACMFARNIAQYKAAFKALRESEQKYRTLTDNSPDVIMRLDGQGRHLFVSPAITRYTGRRPADFLGKTHREVGAPEPLVEFWEHHIAHVFETGMPQETQYEMSGPQGPVVFECKLLPERDADGQVVSLLVVSRDTTERKRLEAQLLHSQKMEAIGQLAGGIAHDFNNLLTGILGYANMLKLEAPSGTLAFEAAKTIQKAGERAAELTRQLLGFARRGKYMSVPVDLHDVIREVVNLLGRTLDKNIAIIQRLRAGHRTVQGDPNQLEQAILNLAVNARDAMPEGGELSFETHTTELDEDFCRRYLGVEPGHFLVVCVSDTGMGIPRHIQDRIFEPFFTTKEQGKGTGMGLAMVYGIVHNHGGAIRVYSELDKGSVFKVYLPLAAVHTDEPATEAADVPRTGSGRVLLVDDDEVVRRVGAEMLRSLGYQVAVVPGGREAVEYYRHHGDGVDLVVIDLVMPQMGGRDCYRALRVINPSVKAVLSTGYGLDQRVQEVLAEGMRGFVQKPYKVAELAHVVARVLREEQPVPAG